MGMGRLLSIPGLLDESRAPKGVAAWSRWCHSAQPPEWHSARNPGYFKISPKPFLERFKGWQVNFLQVPLGRGTGRHRSRGQLAFHSHLNVVFCSDSPRHFNLAIVLFHSCDGLHFTCFPLFCVNHSTSTEDPCHILFSMTPSQHQNLCYCFTRHRTKHLCPF